MSQPHVLRSESRQAKPATWTPLCKRRDLVANSGVVAWCEGSQIALFYLPRIEGRDQFYAIDNRDPQSGANVIGRGIVCQIKGEPVIASPLYKQHFRLTDGGCLEYPEQHLKVWPVRLNADRVEILLGGGPAAALS